MDELSVKVTKHAGRKYLIMYYDDPITGKREQRSTKRTRRREAEREAAKWEADLRAGRYRRASNITWDEFRQRYEDEVLTTLAKNTDHVVGAVFNGLERILRLKRLRDITAERLSYWQKELRAENIGTADSPRQRSEATICTYLAHFKAALKWAVDMGLLANVPKVKMPKRAKGQKVMKGRPTTTEEFERMLDKTEAVVGSRAAPSWQDLLTGLWLSGLRLGESLDLYWDRDDKLGVDLDGRRPMFRIRAELEKGNRDRVLPMTPDFAEFLEAIPQDERTGPVFRPLKRRGTGECREVDWVSKIICRIGKAANVKVHSDAKTGRVKYASAHDLRRSFGTRWAPRVMPLVLQQLMRHESIDTTLRYYVGLDAETTADAIWEAAERVGTSVGTSQIHSNRGADEKPQTLSGSRLS